MKRVSTFIVACFFTLPILSQTEKPESLQNKLKEQISLTDQLLRETEGQTQKTEFELNILSKQIRLRRQLLNQLNSEIASNSQEITELSEIIEEMENDIDTIVANYGKTVRLTYKSMDSDNFWLSVLSASSLSEAYYRALYFQQFSQFRKDQLSLIRASQQFLSDKQIELQESITRAKNLIAGKREEMARLEVSEKKQQSVYNMLKKEENNFKKLLEGQRKSLKKMIGVAEASTQGLAVIKDKNYAASFYRNKGFHSWPVPSNKGIIVGKFGETEDSYGNRITNDGIYIRTPKGQEVRCIYDGTVTAVQKIPLSGYAVIVEHGDYRSVYANLELSYVNKGDQISINERIGSVRTDRRSGETILNFLIYKIPDSFEDPENWIVDTGK
ncbi:MAG: peptidoglycan DD-metalloendopeptidase family protein [Bacteroidota bacterium]